MGGEQEDVAEEIVTEILARLPLRSIARFKTVCRRWKSGVESVYFRRRFVSVHKKSTCGWSLIVDRDRELFKFHGCETWGLPKSIASYFEELRVELYVEAFSYNGLVWLKGPGGASYVGNPVLQEWVILPPVPFRYTCVPFGLVTATDKDDGSVVGFKVVYLAAAVGLPWRDKSSTFLPICVYSSETGIWTFNRLRFPLYFTTPAGRPLSFNGTLYITQSNFRRRVDTPVAIFAHDFYGESEDLCRGILLPNPTPLDLLQSLTVCCGFVTYIKTIGDNLVKVWRLNNDDDSWQLLWDIPLQFDLTFYVPLSMHPFDPNLVYLWSQENLFLLSCNLKTQTYKILRDHQGFSLNQSLCEISLRSSKSILDDDDVLPLHLFQFVLPQWMESMPCPPQLEIMDTASLLAYVASLPEGGK